MELQIKQIFLIGFVTIFTICCPQFANGDNEESTETRQLTVQFRNETTLVVLWQPSKQVAPKTHYRISIAPNDAEESVNDKGESSAPTEAKFNGLVPGRVYNISVKTQAENQESLETTALYRTVPAPPSNVSFDPQYTTTNSFRVRWKAPEAKSDYDGFQVSLESLKKVFTVPRTEDNSSHFDYSESLESGKTYDVQVKTISGRVVSQPVTAQITLLPKAAE